MAKTHTTARVPAAGRTCQPCSEQGTSSTSLADCREETGRTGAVEDEGETQHHDDKAQDSCVKPQLKSRKSTTEWIDADKRNSSFFLRPSPSRSHLKQLNRTKSAVVSASAPRRNTPVSTSTGLDAAPMPRVSKTEFQNLPSSVQQKYFSELERLRLVQHFGVAHASTPSFNFALPLPIRTAAAPPVSSTQRPRRASQRTSFSAESRASSARRPSIHSSSTESHLYSEKLRRRRPSQDHRKLANRRPHSVAPDKLDEAILKIQAKRLRQHEQLKAMASTENTAGTANRNSFYESFRWLEDDDALDLRLGWDHFTNTLPEGQVAPLQKPDSGLNRRPSFRRHLSINKLSFSRPSATQSRPGTKDTVNAPSFRSQPIPAPAKPSGHIRRKSRALSLISMNKQAATEAPGMIDPSASHYQDPSARNTLRQYTASPQKFDEALEYGFPSLGEVVEKDEKNSGFAPYKLRTFLDDDKSSTYSNDSTVSDPDSPKTPPIVDKALPTQHSRTCTPSESPDLGCASGPNSREMTLRMTLTRPDLRANDEQIYGWKKSAAVRKAHMRGEALAPVQPERQPGVKDMEKHFDALDQENIEPSEKGGMRRFWKRVRRA